MLSKFVTIPIIALGLATVIFGGFLIADGLLGAGFMTLMGGGFMMLGGGLMAAGE